MNQYPHLFQPLRVKNVIFRNRIFSSPHMLCYANWDGSPSLQMIKFFEEKAKGGCAMVTMGDTPVDEVNGVGIPRHIKLIDQNVNLLAELAYAIKKNGAVASFELNHPGNTARNPDGRPAWGPDGFVRPDGCTVLEMDEDMIAHTVECYAKAAAVLKRAGWDMCILHGAHGWLLGQFLSPAYNHRTDRFGGSLETPLNVYAAVQVFPDPNAENTGGEEYQKSDAIESNKANTLFGDGTRSNNSRCEIETFRHLSNIRYMDTAAVFAVTARSLDWTSDSVKVYGTAARGALSVSAGKDIGFPSIPALRSNQTLDGTGGLLNRIAGVFTGGNVISNLKLDETSIADDAEYLGLFRKNAGTIYNLRLLNPQVEIASGKLKGVGAVCGYSNGSLKGDNVDGTQARVKAALTSAQAQGAVTQWLNFLDEVEHRYKGLRVTNFSIADYDYVANNTQAVSTNLITGTLEIYMCVSDKEADA